MVHGETYKEAEEAFGKRVAHLKIEMGGKAILGLSRLDYPSAKTGEAVNGGAEGAVRLVTVDWLDWLCYSRLLAIQFHV